MILIKKIILIIDTKNGEFSLIYNHGDKMIGVPLNLEQHALLQVILGSLGKITVCSKIEVNFKIIK